MEVQEEEIEKHGEQKMKFQNHIEKYFLLLYLINYVTAHEKLSVGEN